MLQQHSQDLERLFLQPDPNAFPVQLASLNVNVEDAKTDVPHSRGWIFHDDNES
jgi:hypothetical protein